jgi:ankyrin repeat protein
MESEDPNERVEEIIRLVNRRDEAGWTPLMSAVSAGKLHTVEDLLRRGAKAHAYNKNGQCVLHYHKGRVAIAELIIASLMGNAGPRGAADRIDWADSTGSTPFMRACRAGAEDVVRALLATKCIDLNKSDDAGNTALHFAVSEGYDRLALLLIEAGADHTLQDAEGRGGLFGASDQLRNAASNNNDER